MGREHGIDGGDSSRDGIPPYPLLAEAEVRRRRNPRFALRCLSCGYRALSADLTRCPMCGDEALDFAEWRPFHR